MAKTVPLFWGEVGDPNRRQVGTAVAHRDGRLDLRVDDEQAQAFLAGRSPLGWSIQPPPPGEPTVEGVIARAQEIIDGPWPDPEPPEGFHSPLPLHRTEANGGMVCGTCDGGGCYDCTDPA